MRGCIGEDVRGNVGTVLVGVPGLVSDFDCFQSFSELPRRFISFGRYLLNLVASLF